MFALDLLRGSEAAQTRKIQQVRGIVYFAYLFDLIDAELVFSPRLLQEFGVWT